MGRGQSAAPGEGVGGPARLRVLAPGPGPRAGGRAASLPTCRVVSAVAPAALAAPGEGREEDAFSRGPRLPLTLSGDRGTQRRGSGRERPGGVQVEHRRRGGPRAPPAERSWEARRPRTARRHLRDPGVPRRVRAGSAEALWRSGETRSSESAPRGVGLPVCTGAGPWWRGARPGLCCFSVAGPLDGSPSWAPTQEGSRAAAALPGQKAFESGRFALETRTACCRDSHVTAAGVPEPPACRGRGPRPPW